MDFSRINLLILGLGIIVGLSLGMISFTPPSDYYFSLAFAEGLFIVDSLIGWFGLIVASNRAL